MVDHGEGILIVQNLKFICLLCIKDRACDTILKWHLGSLGSTTEVWVLATFVPLKPYSSSQVSSPAGPHEGLQLHLFLLLPPSIRGGKGIHTL